MRVSDTVIMHPSHTLPRDAMAVTIRRVDSVTNNKAQSRTNLNTDVELPESWN